MDTFCFECTFFAVNILVLFEKLKMCPCVEYYAIIFYCDAPLSRIILPQVKL